MLRWLKLSLVALVGCSFLGMILYALWMRDEIKSAQLEPPLISAPEVALKRRPEEPGGMEIPNRDKLVFDLLDNSASATAPIPAPVDADMADSGDILPAQPVAAMISVTTPTLAQVSATSVTSTERTADQLAMARIAAGAAEESLNDASQAPAQAAQASPTVISKLAVQEAKPAAEQGGAWGVQLAAVGTQDDAVASARGLQGKYPALKGLTPRTSRVVSGSGARYRVQFFGIANRAAATRICDQLGDKQPCFPVGG